MFTPIRTARLTLRPVTLDDLDDVYAYQRRPDVCRWTLHSEPRTREQSRESVTAMAGENALRSPGDVLTLAVETGRRLTGTVEADRRVAGTSGPDRRVIGTVELVWRSVVDRTAEIGYVFHPEFGGRGLATEAVTALLRWGFEEFGLHRVYGRCHAGNEASARLMSRLGMRCEARHVQSYRFRDGWADQLVFALLAGEWPDRATTRPDRATTRPDHATTRPDQASGPERAITLPDRSGSPDRAGVEAVAGKPGPSTDRPSRPRPGADG
ncbi:GNAT family N-acetyltransferase [Micromonospora cathayae]|uniref:GNAT family N-acetyltransferase n=1 Tax=Micromonospora cathayae TaxID=3028804 RepID=A0ABY7ZUH7_9ACTN|nr:GNAT family N-acetyltransferase [Micromonospora sp. HUAS 3]WDZ86707.1 GNAT family N-acetyltransferase [Micromonospora sp. HUAS 3]